MSWSRAYSRREAGIDQRTLGTASVINGGRKGRPLKHVADGGDNVHRAASQVLRQGDLDSFPGLRKEKGTFFDRRSHHFFEAHGLGTELHFRVSAMARATGFVFDRADFSVRRELDDITFADQAVEIGPNGEGPLNA
jgi:hypothetical protein